MAEIREVSNKARKPYAVRWKSASGRDYQIIIPAQMEGESDKDFQQRQRKAISRASEYDVGGELVAQLQERSPGLSMTELMNTAMIELMNKIDGQKTYLQELKKMEPGQHAENLKSKAALDMMRYEGEKAALKSFILTHPIVVPFKDETGEGMSFTLTEKGVGIDQMVDSTPDTRA